jgi:hypothetical protein
VNRGGNSVNVASRFVVSDFISLRHFSGIASAATAWAVLVAWMFHLAICSSQGFGHYGQDGHSHSATSQADSHHDKPEETPDDSDCCAVPQDISVASFKKWGGGIQVHFVQALTPIPFAALAVGTSPPRWAVPPTVPPGLPKPRLITPLWPNAPPTIMDFSREGRVTAG